MSHFIQQLYNPIDGSSPTIAGKGASDAVFDRFALFDQLATIKRVIKTALQAIQAFQAELATTPSANEVTKPTTTV